jgi:SAM-dependent methyltransferase
MLTDAIRTRTLKKLILSRPADKAILRTEGHLFEKKGEVLLQLETFTADGKALHRNLTVDEAPEAVLALFEGYRQMNLLTTGGDAEARLSSKGKLLVSGKIKTATATAVTSHDREKKHILKEGNRYDFLVALGVTDANGSVFDKKRAKFRQIDRFLQYINEIVPRLPKEGEIYVLDLCCGKSYLTFAAYWFLTAVKGRQVAMLGADRKADVIAYCAEVAKSLGYDRLTFRCCDITELTPDRKPDLVLSLHACDIATDIVLTTAARLGAEVILSTPCCHHQVFDQLNASSKLGSDLAPILEHSLLKQKLAVALTDALRCKRLEAAGYAVDVTELIDPENTPKNLMIRAIRTPMSEAAKKKHAEEFQALQALAGVKIWGGE